jgi:transposase, IS5 family
MQGTGERRMSIDQSGFGTVVAKNIVIKITDENPLIQLANALPWSEIEKMVLPDLKATTKKKKWWMGRPLRLRIHLGAYFLQQLFGLTDRQIEYSIKDNAAYQLFCGKFLVKQWHCPDRTKIEEFRTRLSPNTQKKLANVVAHHAVFLGYADASAIDIDSTVQEANMRYPTDGNLLCKIGAMAKKVASYLNGKLLEFKIKPMEVDLKGIKSRARRYFFAKKAIEKPEKTKLLAELLDYVATEIKLVISNSRCMGQRFIEEMPWNIKKIFLPFIEKGRKYLADVKLFLETGVMVADKILFFHLNEVCCFIKGKPGKKYQFGRTFQLARIKGNFLFAGKCETSNQSDKQSIKMMLETHAETFDNKQIHSATTDKGYYSAKNEKLMTLHGVKEIGIQRPHNVRQKSLHNLPKYREDELINRRAGIEPLIGHAKNRSQLGRSRMKLDRTIEASGFSSILGFNLKQMMRYKTGKIKFEAT